MDTFWVGVALVIFLAILVKFGVPGAIVKALDSRGEKVAQELAEARRLRQEAEKLLAEYDAKRKAAEQAVVKRAIGHDGTIQPAPRMFLMCWLPIFLRRLWMR